MELTYERIEERDQPVTLSQVQVIAADIVRAINAARLPGGEPAERANARQDRP